MGRIITCLDCKQKKKHHGLGLCKTCYNRQYRKTHPEETRAYHRQYAREHREYFATNQRRWRKANPERNKELDRRRYDPERIARWRQENPEKAKAILRRWRENNPEKLRAQRRRSKARRRAHKNGIPHTLTIEEAKEVRAIGEATYPSEELHFDHVIPISKGGGTTRANIHAIPARMNISKGDKLPKQVFEQLALEV